MPSLTRCWLLLLLTLAGCGGAPEPVHQQQSYVFGTLVEITVHGVTEDRARAAIAPVLREFDRLHTRLHAWKPGELQRLNEALAAGAEVEVDEELKAMLQNAAALEQKGGGLFNPAIGRLVRLWGFHADDFTPVRPDEEAIDRLIQARPSLSQLVFRGNRVSSPNPEVQIDLGGYAKGHALDVAARMLREQGIHNALINIGGNVLALGRRGGRPWRVGIRHPREPGPLATLDLEDGEAIGTSGDYQRYFMLDGRRYCHLIDPRSGHPAQGVQAVTVVTRGGLLSDAGTKPLFIAGPSGWRAMTHQLGIEQAMLVDDEGAVHITPALKRRLTFVARPAAIHEVP